MRWNILQSLKIEHFADIKSILLKPIYEHEQTAIYFVQGTEQDII